MRIRFSQLSTLMIAGLALSLVAGPASALAAEQQSSAAAAPAPSPFRLGIALSASTNLYAPGDVDHSAEASVDVLPSYKINDTLTASATFTVVRELTGLEEASVARSNLGLRHKGRQLNPYLRLSPALSVALPLVRDTRARQSLIVGTSVSGRLYFDLAPAGIQGLSGYYDLAFGKSFHEYTTSTTGASNTHLRLSHTIVASYGFLGDFTFEVAFMQQTGWTYKGNTTKGLFDFNQELAYGITPDVTLAVGHNNTGGVLAANGLDTNISIFNERSSTVYTTLSFSL